MTQKAILTLTTESHICQNLFSTLSVRGPIKPLPLLPSTLLSARQLEKSSSTVNYLIAFYGSKLSGACPHHYLSLSSQDHILSLVCSLWASRFLHPAPASLVNSSLPVPHHTFSTISSLLVSFTNWLLPENTHLLTAPKALVLCSVSIPMSIQTL